MRMRKKPNLAPRMERCSDILIADPSQMKGKWLELKPDAKLGMLFGDIMVKPWEYADQLHVDYLHPMKMNIYVPGFGEGTKAAGYGINMWTINDEETMVECLKQDAGIITNYPDVAVALKNK